ncbi:MAG: hypothetical protein AAFZ65_18385 [Planctomycetota bacterium]
MKRLRRATGRWSLLVATGLVALSCSDRSSHATTRGAELASADALPASPGHPADSPQPAPQTTASGERDWAAFLEEVPAGNFDPLTVPMGNGIVWYGTWEAAMAEKERTGKPVALHFGSPRCPNGTVCVPGTW